MSSTEQQLIIETNAGFAELRADPEAWAEELAERAVWDGAIGDGLTVEELGQPTTQLSTGG